MIMKRCTILDGFFRDAAGGGKEGANVHEVPAAVDHHSAIWQGRLCPLIPETLREGQRNNEITMALREGTRERDEIDRKELGMCDPHPHGGTIDEVKQQRVWGGAEDGRNYHLCTAETVSDGISGEKADDAYLMADQGSVLVSCASTPPYPLSSYVPFPKNPWICTASEPKASSTFADCT